MIYGAIRVKPGINQAQIARLTCKYPVMLEQEMLIWTHTCTLPRTTFIFYVSYSMAFILNFG